MPRTIVHNIDVKLKNCTRDGSEHFTLVGVVSGNPLGCVDYRQYPDYFAFIGHHNILTWVREKMTYISSTTTSTTTTTTTTTTAVDTTFTFNDTTSPPQPPRDGGWGAWSSFTPCSATCGGGSRIELQTKVCEDFTVTEKAPPRCE